MDLKVAAKTLFERFTQTGSLGPGAQRQDIPEGEDTQRNVAISMSLMRLEGYDGQIGIDRDDRPNFIRVNSSIAAEAEVQAAREQVEMMKELMDADGYRQAQEQLDALAAEARADTSEMLVEVDRREASMEKFVTVETLGDKPECEYVYSALPAKIHISVTPEGSGFKATAQVLVVQGTSFEETLQGDWNLLN